jgi:hypothetical protein
MGPRPERSARRTDQLRRHARTVIERAGVAVGGDHLIDPIADAIATELETMRIRMGSVVRTLAERGDVLVSVGNPRRKQALLDLADAIENHYVDEHGTLQVAMEDDE